MDNNFGTYKLRRVAIMPPSSLIGILTSGLLNKEVKPPLKRDSIRSDKDTINILAFRHDAIYLLQVKLKS